MEIRLLEQAENSPSGTRPAAIAISLFCNGRCRREKQDKNGIGSIPVRILRCNKEPAH